MTKTPGFWKHLIDELFPEEPDSEKSELATVMFLFIKMLQDEWGGLSRFVGPDEKRSIGMNLGIDRTENPTGIDLALSYSAKHKRKMHLEAEDPNQLSFEEKLQEGEKDPDGVDSPDDGE